MKKFWIITLSIFLSIVLIITCTFAYNVWKDIKEIRYCDFAMNGDDEVFFRLEDGKYYTAIPFPSHIKRADVVPILTSMSYEKKIDTTYYGEYRFYLNPFEEGDEYAVFVPSPELSEFFPKPFACSDARPLAFYAVEVELDE